MPRASSRIGGSDSGSACVRAGARISEVETPMSGATPANCTMRRAYIERRSKSRILRESCAKLAGTTDRRSRLASTAGRTPGVPSSRGGMCGIAGELRFDGRPADAAVLARMSAALEPRGPDGHGVWVQDGAGLGHRRLSIIDLSERGAQPMVDPHLGLAVAFNGCIYNYRELRRELAADGYSFSSTSDTEVLMKAYHRWGERFVDRLAGMFAFVLVERSSGRAILGRDRLGIKPLYLADGDGCLRFASTLPALLAGGEVDTRLDPVALHHYLSWHAVVPAPHTVLRGVRKLPPATVLVVEPGGERRAVR